ncbi:AbgT family transporter [Aridibaculum aurantiacum]|uniref:AbgT family transporter n=1 Tax=Aridibaculum aurantiacum TaxID=2810307 RepID=UPI001A978364|nr:AbgT family transporter [Aridibaculum aurantiacum]
MSELPRSPRIRRSFTDRSLVFIEKVGNALPDPATLFLLFAVLIMIISWMVSMAGVSVNHPGTGEAVAVKNLLSKEGLDYMLTNLVKNFTGFAPLGTVLVALLGIGIAEGSGLIGTVMRKLVLSAPEKLITFVVVFAGVISNTASEVGYVLLVPLAAIIFLAYGRHPIAGLAAAFAGVSGGYSANLLLGTVDPLLAGLSQEAAHIIDPKYLVNPACNYYFMAASTFLITLLGTLITEKFVIPRLGKYTGDEKPEEIRRLTHEERKGLLYAMLTLLVITGLILWGLVPENGFLRDAKTGEILHSPFMSGIVAIIFLTAALAGIAYGIGAGTIKSDRDVVKGMSKSMATLGSYIVLVFFAAQFVAFFNWTNLGLVLAINGANALKAANVGTVPLMILFILLTACINLFMGSASAKWAIMAPVFIPMFMLLNPGVSPELTQLAYRIGDSVTNIVSPMMSYFALIVAFIQRYDKKAGLGTMISLMLPYSIIFLIGWIIFFIIWYYTGLPIGPGAGVHYLP